MAPFCSTIILTGIFISQCPTIQPPVLMMVNPGHPSRGCWTCRTRKIKCDESNPICARCVKARRVCLSYSNSRQSTYQPEAETHILGYDHITIMTKKTNMAVAPIEKALFLTNDAFYFAKLDLLEKLPTLWNSDQLVALTAEVTTLGFQSLNSPSQNTISRNSLLQKYGLAMHQLRKTLLSRPNGSILFIPILLFSLFEVRPASKVLEDPIVSIDQNGRWL